MGAWPLRRQRTFGAILLFGAVCLSGVLALLRPVLAQTPAPVISPADITTPTPGAARLPTPTAAAPAGDPEPPGLPAPTNHLPADTPMTYTVKAGDTLFSVALEMGIDLEEAPCAVSPAYTLDQPLVISDVITAPPANVICHEVQAGETLAGIAARYGLPPDQIRALAWNQLAAPTDALLPPRTHLRVPLPLPTAAGSLPLPEGDLAGADFLAIMLNSPVNTSPFVVFAQRGASRKPTSAVSGPIPADWPYGSGAFAWPVYGWLSQSYRYDHRAIDVAAPQGTPVTAADRGVVLRAGWNNQGYGRFVIIDHKIDYVTLYAHLDRVLVAEGEVVGKGQVIGTVGSTGNSTGPHLHFEIRDFGRLTNPLELLALP